MTTKSTTFKRVALALVAALSFGVLGGANSNALLTNSDSLTLSASSASVAPGETATVTATVTFSSTTASETAVLVVDDLAGTGTGAPTTSIIENAWGITTDSVNVASAAASGWRVNTAVSAVSDIVITSTSSTAKVVTAKTTFAFVVGESFSVAATTPYVYTISLAFGTSPAVTRLASFTVNVTPRNTTAVATKSLLWLNQADFSASPVEADSALVVSAGKARGTAAQTFTAVGYLGADHRNSSDTNVATGANVDGNITVNISGPGGLVVGAAAATLTCTNPQKSVTMTNANDKAVICSDGTAGTATITGYLSSAALSQGSKTITFYGPATSFTATANDITATGGFLSSAAADSTTVGNAIVTFTAKDSAGNTIAGPGTAASKFGQQGPYGTVYCISSDTSVVGASSTGLGTDLYIEPVWNATNSNWECDMVVRKAGTATITIGDSRTVATSVVSSSAITIKTETKTGYTGTISFDKSTYTVGELAVITVTSKAKTTGNNVGQAALSGSASNPFVDIVQNRPFSGAKSGYGFGGGSGLSWDLGSSTFVNGVETYVVYMPNTSGAVTLTGFTSYDSSTSNTAVSVSVTVTDPAETAANAATAAAKAAETAAVAAAKTAETAAVAAAKAAQDAAVAAAQKAATDAVAAAEKAAKDAVAAADAAKAAAVAEAAAATDAALEAIDAANAATDAANLAAEAADAATVAAEEARDAADAATAAVEALATEVATLMAALKAQITTLANTVAKIAKKVRA